MAGHNHSHDHGHHPGDDMDSVNPVLVDVIRGDMTESRHRGSIAICDAHGRVELAIGDIMSPVFPRSGIKPLQALALVETGAAKAFGLGHATIALACASHNGSVTHVDIVGNWLDKIGLTPDDLECGPSLPWTDEDKHALYETGLPPTTLHDNCSGKHTGFLTVCKHMDYPVQGYTRFEHPIQQRVLGILEQMSGMELFEAPKGIDGCGIPTIGIPLGNIALAMARLADPHDQPEERQAACRRIRGSMAAEPYLVAGKGRFCTRVIEALGQAALVKTGAEGVYCATLSDLKLGVALKIDDGSRRAAEAVMIRILQNLDIITDRAKGQLLNLLEPAIQSRAGKMIGLVRIADGVLL
jgi:L-asparaginase II